MENLPENIVPTNTIPEDHTVYPFYFDTRKEKLIKELGLLKSDNTNKDEGSLLSEEEIKELELEVEKFKEGLNVNFEIIKDLAELKENILILNNQKNKLDKILKKINLLLLTDNNIYNILELKIKSSILLNFIENKLDNIFLTSKNDQLEKVEIGVKKLEQEIENLKQKIENLFSSELMIENDKKIIELKKEIEPLEKKIKSLKKEIEELEQKIEH